MIASPEVLMPVPARPGPTLRGFGVAGSCRGATEASDYDLLGELSSESPIALPKPKKKPRQTSALAHRSSDGRRVTLRTV